MDASEADSDVKLYKASAELLAEVQIKFPLLVNSKDGHLRKWVLGSKTAEVMKLLDSFQEWPQLLDSVLGKLMQVLVDAFLQYCMRYRHIYNEDRWACAPEIEPLPRCICRLVYVLCKVRGQKIIVRLLNNEPKYIETILSSFRSWSSHDDDGPGRMVWQERYVMLLWLSHLMLAPFELSSISTMSAEGATLPESMKIERLPEVAENLLSLGLQHLTAPGKDREAACTLIVRLSLRGDMQRCQMPQILARWSGEQMRVNSQNPTETQYHHIGVLTLLFNLVRSASDSEAASFDLQAFRVACSLASSTSTAHVTFRDSAPTRKLLVKIIRASTEHAISLATKGESEYAENLEDLLENAIDILLNWLADSDTPVRQAVSKALSIIARKLDTEMSAEVIEAVLGCLEENVLLEDTKTGHLIAAPNLPKSSDGFYVKNLNAVDPLKWHGAMLTLGHLLFRRSAPVHQLGTIIESLLMGLQFEQRSNVGTSVGVGVRDAACFGIWSLSRKYSTAEVCQAPITESVISAQRLWLKNDQSTLQIVATQLVVSSCLDPSGNLRRGASAALQELIGRHPDAIIQGIPLVQVVDYHAVARRSRAMVQVLSSAAKLNQVYHYALLNSLLDWRGVRATDSDSRWQAATAIASLFHLSRPEEQAQFAAELIRQIRNLRSTNTGTTSSARQGLLATVASIILSEPVLQSRSTSSFVLFQPILSQITSVTGKLDGRPTADLLNVLEAVAKLINAGACPAYHESPQQALLWYSSIKDTLDRCTLASEDEAVAKSAADANCAIFKLLDDEMKLALLKNWLSAENSKKHEFASKGHIRSLGLIYCVAMSSSTCFEMCTKIVEYLHALIEGDFAMETKVNAMQSVVTILKSRGSVGNHDVHQLLKVIRKGLSDYTVDQRGDVGSLLRLASLHAVQAYMSHFEDLDQIRDLIAIVARLATEKLTKVRFHAWNCLEIYWKQGITKPSIVGAFNHQADVCSSQYYFNLAQLLQVTWIHDQIILGIISSLGAGTDDIGRACSEGLVSFLLQQEPTVTKKLVGSATSYLLNRLELQSRKDDRDVVPAIECLSFLVEQFSTTLAELFLSQDEAIIKILNELQTTTASLERIEALIRLWSALSTIDSLRARAMDQVTRKLLHKWPKVRGQAADVTFLNYPDQKLIGIDWNAPPLQNKGEVVELRKQIGVAGLSKNAAATKV